jgi:DNA-binding transcriptional LysR family regulator
MIHLQQIRCFVVLARELNFARAAEKLNMTQPPLSRQIQQLEKTLGARLLDRDRRHVMLTAAGRALLAEAEYLLQSSESAVIAARQAFKGSSGKVSLGHAINCKFLPDVIVAASMRLPDVQISLQEMTDDEQLDLLHSGRLDLGLLPMPPESRDLDFALVLREDMLAAVPRQHRLAGQSEMRIADFHDEPTIMFPPGSEGVFHHMLTGMFAQHGVSPRYVQLIRHLHSILALVNLGVGLALLPASASRMQFPNVVWLPLFPAASAVSELYLVWRRQDEKDNPVVNEMRRFIISQASLS